MLIWYLISSTAEVISGIRTIRKDKNIPLKMQLNNQQRFGFYLFWLVVTKLGNIAALEYVSEKVDGALSFRVKSKVFYSDYWN
jgi:valyl-tRNA synthetase